MRKIIFHILFLFLVSANCFAQTDSIYILLKLPDTNEKCEKLISFAKKTSRKEPEKSVELVETAAAISKKLNNEMLYIRSQLQLADIYYWEFSNFPLVKSILNNLKEKYFAQMNNGQKCFFYSRMGDVVYFDNEFVLSMQNYYKALDYVGTDSLMLARLYHNIGWVYADFGKKEKAVYFGEKGLEVAKKINKGVGHKLEGLVHIYSKLRLYDKALKYLDDAQKLSPNASYYYYRKAGLFLEKGNRVMSTKLYFEGYKAAKLNKDQRFEANNLLNYITDNIMLNNVGEAINYLPALEKLLDGRDKNYECSPVYLLFGENYLQRNKLDSSKYFLMKALRLQLLNNQSEVGITYRALSEWYVKNGDLKTSREYLSKYISFKDSLDVRDSIANIKTINDQLHMYEVENALNVKNIEMQKNELQLEQEKMQKFGFLIGLVVMFLFAIYVYKNLVGRKKINAALTLQKEKLSSANEELTQQNEEIAAQRDEIEQQKELVEEHQKATLDSIHYAKRIQTALLPSNTFLKKNLNDFFILYKPKDIVSGDFYWSLRKDDDLFIAVADCTGHGVPGAFMSMIGINLLNEIILERKISNPALALDILREEIIRNLNPEGSEEGKDGMDMVLCKLNLKTNVLDYAAANNSLYLVRKPENSGEEILENGNVDKMPVGKYHDKVESFTKHTLQLQNGDSVYLITDGYPDQFGGPKGKKFKYKPMEEILLSNASLSMNDQREALNQKLVEWQGFLEQVDDVTVVGIRI